MGVIKCSRTETTEPRGRGMGGGGGNLAFQFCYPHYITILLLTSLFWDIISSKYTSLLKQTSKIKMKIPDIG